MTTYNTGNPIGSTDSRDRLDNTENMDYLENSITELTHADRLGTVRKTRHGMEVQHDAQISTHETEHDNQIAAHETEHDAQMQSFENDFDGRLAGMAFTRVGSFTTGATITDMRQVLIWEVSQGGDGHEYGWAGTFPKVVAASATPATSGGIGAGAWVDRTDEALRGELLSGAMTQRNALFSLRDFVSVKDYGAVVDGVTDDTSAIAAARAEISGVGGTILYNGKTHSPNFWENLAPRVMEWVYGSNSDYRPDATSEKPLTWAKNFVGTPATFLGYGHYATVVDAYTKDGIDVQSGAAAIFRMGSYSNNSTGDNFNRTNQVAVVASANALSATSSASVEAVNGVASSAYTGTLPQRIIGFEADLRAERAAGWFSESNKTYSVGILSNWVGNNFDGTVAYYAGTSNPEKTWEHGFQAAGIRGVGFSVVRNGSLHPTIGLWVAAASSYGLYIGAKALTNLNPGHTANYTYRPRVGIALGQEGANSAPSHTMRFTSTDAEGIEQNCDLQLGPYSLLGFSFNGASPSFGVSSFGTIYVQNLNVVGTRKTGYSAMTGASNRADVYDVSTVTLSQLAARVAAIQQDLSIHGLIGA